MEALAKKYQGQAEFLFVYCREAHPEDNGQVGTRRKDQKPIHQATTMEERAEIAQQFCEDMKLSRRILVDEFGDRSVQRLYGGLPDPTVVVDIDGTVALKMAWTRGKLLDEFLEKFLAGGGRTDLALAATVPFQSPRGSPARPEGRTGTPARHDLDGQETPARHDLDGQEWPSYAGTVQTLTVKSSDGFSFEVAYSVPQGTGPFPVLVYVHGGMEFRGIDGLKRSLRSTSRFWEAGYIVVAATHRTCKDVRKDYDGWTSDVLAAVDAAAKLPQADPNRIVFYGHSGGGSIGLDLAAAGAKLAAIGVGEPAATIFARIHSSADHESRVEIDRKPHDYYDAAAREYTEAKMAKITTPMFFAQGTIHPINIIAREIIYPSLLKMKKDVTMKVYDGKDHGFFGGPNAIFDDLQAFYQKHLTAREQGQSEDQPHGSRRAGVPIVTRRAGVPVLQSDRTSRSAVGRPLLAVTQEPTHANVSYGPHERNVIDIWLAKSQRPTPLVLFIHGGGFIGGDKSQLNAGTLRELLDAGISVAAVNYRLLRHAPLPAAHQDVARALQFLRSKATDWNLDKTRVGGFGGSAGAQLVMYLAFHDDLADAKSDDPIARESTRLTCVAPGAGQVTMDQNWWVKHVPGYDKPHRDFKADFGTTTEEEAVRKNADIAALSLISPDDPPIFMTYGMAPDDPIPSEAQQARNW